MKTGFWVLLLSLANFSNSVLAAPAEYSAGEKCVQQLNLRLQLASQMTEGERAGKACILKMDKQGDTSMQNDNDYINVKIEGLQVMSFRLGVSDMMDVHCTIYADGITIFNTDEKSGPLQQIEIKTNHVSFSRKVYPNGAKFQDGKYVGKSCNLTNRGQAQATHKQGG